MTRKALALFAASSLATTVGAASAADLDDQVSEAVDLAALADLILYEYLNLDETSSTDAQDFALAIGFTFGVAFSSDGLNFSEALSEGLVVTGGDPESFAYIGTIANTLAAPGLVGFRTGVDAVAFDPPDSTLLVQQEMSPE